MVTGALFYRNRLAFYGSAVKIPRVYCVCVCVCGFSCVFYKPLRHLGVWCKKKVRFSEIRLKRCFFCVFGAGLSIPLLFSSREGLVQRKKNSRALLDVRKLSWAKKGGQLLPPRRKRSPIVGAESMRLCGSAAGMATLSSAARIAGGGWEGDRSTVTREMVATGARFLLEEEKRLR